MALTDTFIKNLKATDKPTGTKHPDGGGMYLLVKQSGKYWRLHSACSKNTLRCHYRT